MTKSPYPPDAPWPCFRGDPRNSGTSPLVTEGRAQGPPPRSTRLGHHRDEPAPTVRHFPTGNGVFSTPVLDGDDAIYVGSADHNFYVFDSATGETRWRYETGEVIDSAACLGPRREVTVPSGDAHLWELDNEGVPLWAYTTTEGRERPTLSTNYWWEGNVVRAPDGALVAGSDDFFVYCFEPDGATRWTFRTGFMIWSAAAFHHNIVFIPSFDMNLYALDMKTGAQLWKRDLKNAIVASPALDTQGKLYIGAFDGRLHALNTESGAAIWTTQTGGHIYASAAVAPDNRVYVTSTDGKLYAMNAHSGDILWTYFAGAAIHSSPGLGPDLEHEYEYLVYFGGGDGCVYAVTPEGARRWSYDSRARTGDAVSYNINASPALGNDGLAIASAAGDVIWIPYEYYRGADDAAPGDICCDPTDGFPADGAQWYLLEQDGAWRALDDAEMTVSPTQILALRLLVRHNGQTVDAPIVPGSIRIHTEPRFPLRLALQSDRTTVNIIPSDILAPGASFTIDLNVAYLAPDGSYEGSTAKFKVKTERAAKTNPIVEDKVDGFLIEHMSVYQPAIVTSLDQIGIASLTIPMRIVHIKERESKFIAWGVQKFGVDESGDTVGVPHDRHLVYMFNGVTDGDWTRMESANAFFEITAFPIPLDRCELSGKILADGSFAKGGTLRLQYNPGRTFSGWRRTISSLQEWGRSGAKAFGWMRAQFRSGSEKAGVEAPRKSYPMIEWLDALRKTGSTLMRMGLRRVWKPWGLFNHEGTFIGVGTFRARALPESALLPRDILDLIKVTTIEYKFRSRAVSIDIETPENFQNTGVVLSAFLSDDREEAGLPLNYNLLVDLSSHANGARHKMVVHVPAYLPDGERTPVERLNVHVMADLHELARHPL